MKKFEIPEIETIRFEAADIVATSREDEFPITPISGDEFPLTRIN